MSIRLLAARLALVAAAVVATAAPLHAQPFSVSITVDENGVGRLTNTAGFNSLLTSAVVADPGPGGLGSALTYDLLNPPGLTVGDLFLVDALGGPLSDVIRFNASSFTGGTGSLVFYSMLGGGQLADFGFPAGAYTNVVTLLEGPVFTTYTPTVGQPGFVTGAAGPVTYTIYGSVASVPEPTTWALLATGLVAVGGVAARRRRSDAA